MRYRIWIHPARGSDYAYEYRTKAKAIAAMHKHKRAEPYVYAVTGRGLLTGPGRSATERRLSKKEMQVRTTRRPRRMVSRGRGGLLGDIRF